MSSLWKKQKGNRISRLVADLQTPSKRGGSLVVETGFPTSLVDLFIKNRNKLKKPKTKKSEPKKLSTISEDDDDDLRPSMYSVSHPRTSLYELEVPRCSVVGNCQENVFQNDRNDLFVEEIVAHESPVVNLNDHINKLETHGSSKMKNHGSCKIENHESCEIERHDSSNIENHDSSITENNEKDRENGEVSTSNNIAVFSIVIGALIFVVTLYTKRWFLALITLGFLVLFLLDYLGNLDFGICKPGNNCIWISILKGSLVMVVALYTKWFVIGITIGASLLLLLEYSGNSIFGFFKPCQDANRKLQGILPNWDDSKQRREFGERRKKGGRGVLSRVLLIGSKREIPSEGSNGVVSWRDLYQGVEKGYMSSREVEPQCNNGLPPKRGHKLTSEEDGDVIYSKKDIEQESGNTTLRNKTPWLLEEEKQNKAMYEPLALESNDTKNPMSSDFRGSICFYNLLGEKGAIERIEEGGEESKIVSHIRKLKKNKKFWKKLVPKRRNNEKKKHEHGTEHCASQTDDIHETATELEEEREVDELEKSDEEGLSSSRSNSTSTLTSSSSLSNEEDERGIDNFEAANTRITEMLQLKNRATGSCGMVKERSGTLKYLTAMVIPLSGLVGGQIFAVVVTVICCLVFKMVRS